MFAPLYNILIMDSESLPVAHKLAALLSQNTEYLTTIYHSLSPSSPKNLELANKYIENNNSVKMDYGSFVTTLVEIGYLSFASKHYTLSLLIDLNDIRVREFWGWG